MSDPAELRDLPLPAELTYDDAPPLSDADLEAYGDAAVQAAHDHLLEVEEVDLALLVTEADDGYAARHLVPVAVRSFRIEDDATADWAMAKVGAIDAELAELTSRADAYRRRIGAWFDHAAKPLVGRRRLLEGHLKDYARRERVRDPKRKTLVLPTGRVSSRGASAPSVKVADEDAVIAWAKAHLEGDELAAVVKVVESVRVSNLREHVTVGQLTVGLMCEAWLECGCTVDRLVMLETPTTEPLTIEQRSAVAPWAIGEVVECGLCGAAFPVNQVATELHQINAVLDEAGAPVPGTIIEAPTTTFTVSPDA
jgi:phage host-nuclease inhibitor protein Gam